jgi:hypothetical protein
VAERIALLGYADEGRRDGRLWKDEKTEEDAMVGLRRYRKAAGIDGRKWGGREYARSFLEVANASKP